MKTILVPFSRWLNPVDKLAFDTQLHCDKARELWRNDWQKEEYDFCALVGGNWLPKEVETLPIAKLMAEELASGDNAISQEYLIVEQRSANTWENIEMLCGALRERKITDFELVCLSQWQHNARIWIICRALKVPARFITLWYSPGTFRFFYEIIGFAMAIVDATTYRFFGVPILARLNAKKRRK